MSRRAIAVAVVALAAWTAALIAIRGDRWQALLPATVVTFLVFPLVLRFRRHWRQALKAYGGIFVYAYLLGVRDSSWNALWLRSAFAVAAGAVLGLVVLDEIRNLDRFRPDLNGEPVADS